MITEPVNRADYINALYALAGYLHAHPDVPVPTYGTDILVNQHGEPDNGRTDVDNAAAVMNTDVAHHRRYDGNDEFAAIRDFGPVVYKVYTIVSAQPVRAGSVG